MLIFSILVPLWFIVISLVFFCRYGSKLLFSGCLQFQDNFLRGQIAKKNPVSKSSFNKTIKESFHSFIAWFIFFVF